MKIVIYLALIIICLMEITIARHSRHVRKIRLHEKAVKPSSGGRPQASAPRSQTKPIRSHQQDQVMTRRPFTQSNKTDECDAAQTGQTVEQQMGQCPNPCNKKGCVQKRSFCCVYD